MIKHPTKARSKPEPTVFLPASPVNGTKLIVGLTVPVPVPVPVPADPAGLVLLLATGITGLGTVTKTAAAEAWGTTTTVEYTTTGAWTVGNVVEPEVVAVERIAAHVCCTRERVLVTVTALLVIVELT